MAVINIEQLRTAQGTLEKYRSGKANLDNKLIENEDWWKMNHERNFKGIAYERTDDGRVVTKNDHVITKKQSAWLFNSIMNKHADVMDNFPEPVIHGRAKDDESAAEILSKIVPVVLDRCRFEDTYSDAQWDKLCSGSCIYGVTYNTSLLNGIGDIEIKEVDLLSIYWEPGIQDIQDSHDIFVLSLVDNKILEQTYPQLEGKIHGQALENKQYNYDDTVDTSDKSTVVDWYYKTIVDGRTTLQYVKWVNDEILYSSEDDENHPEYREEGFYSHGKYPFVMDVLFPEKGTPMGFGYIDIMKSAQEYIDDMNADLQENMKWASRPRFFEKDEGAINQSEFQDLNQQIVHVAGSLDEAHVRQITTQPISGNYLNIYQAKIDELKETSGNRDFSQGSTSSGVTSGSAIAALQEAGSKGSRDMIKGAYRAFSELCELVIELMRQFYDTPRTFRIVGVGGPEFVDFDNSMLQGGSQSVMGEDFHTKQPVFDINVKAQKSNPYSRLAQNELALEFFGRGFFNPELCDQALATVEMMDFEGKQDVIDKIQRNGTMYERLQQMEMALAQAGDIIAKTTGDSRVLDAMMQMPNGQPMPNASRSANPAPTQADKARVNARNATEIA